MARAYLDSPPVRLPASGDRCERCPQGEGEVGGLAARDDLEEPEPSHGTGPVTAAPQ